MMRVMAMAAVCLAAGVAAAQTHVVKKSENVVRAVAVYEWVGDAAKPTGSRVVPVALFIDGQFEDAGVYMARPVPFALDRGNVFELEKAGDPQGTVELSYQRHREIGEGTAFDDGWMGFGKFKPAAQPVLVAKKSGPLPQIVASGGSGPHFSNKPAGDAAAKPVDRSTAAGSGTTVSADKDPDEPTLHKKTSSAPADDKSTDPDDPSERPTLKRRTPQEQKAEQKKKATASVTGNGDLNDDPDRPSIHRGKPGTSMDEQDIPPLNGIPAGMQQMVAVSDAKSRPSHEFARVWENPDEQADVTAKLEEVARAKLAAYGDVATPPVAPVAAPVATSAQVSKARVGASGSRVKKAAAAATPAPPAPPVPLNDESVRAYTLSYGGAATFVYSASSPGAGGTTRYVSVVAQRDPLGAVQVATAWTTDSAHLDRQAWMRLVDAVDADASNRASLLFEQRGQGSRQFALYRVIGAKAEQVFATANQ